MAARGVPSFWELIEVLFINEETALNYLIEHEVLTVPENCACGGRMNRKKGKPKYYQCSRCKRGRSIVKDTFLGKTTLPVNKIMLICHHWILNVEGTTMAALNGVDRDTVSAWRGHLQQLCMLDLEALTDEQVMLGVPDAVTGARSIVEIDESKLGVRKFNRGHRVNGVWVVGLIERTGCQRFVVVSVEDRSAVTLEAIITKYVMPGTTIYSDMWKGYRTWALNQFGYVHLTVNHSLFFKDPETGIHTNTIEGIWSWVKKRTPSHFRTAARVDGFLWEYMWKRKFHGELWDRLLLCIKNVRYDGEPVYQPAEVPDDEPGVPVNPDDVEEQPEYIWGEPGCIVS